MLDYVEYMCNKHEQEEADAEFFYEHGMTRDEYEQQLEFEYYESKSER